MMAAPSLKLIQAPFTASRPSKAWRHSEANTSAKRVALNLNQGPLGTAVPANGPKAALDSKLPKLIVYP